MTLFDTKNGRMQPILYVHIPKAGGTAVNEFFVQRLGKSACLTHAENRFRGQQPDPERVGKYAFISGRLVYPNLKRYADGGDRFKMTIIRNPIEQLISHIAWIRYQTEPEQRRAFRSLPDHVKRLAEGLSRFDPSNADALEKFLSSLKPPDIGFFDNCQTRYLIPNFKGVISPGMLRRARRNLEAMDFVGLSEYMPDVFDCLAWIFGLTPARDDRRVNVSRRKYGMDASDAALQGVLRPFCALDLELYASARRMFAARVFEMWEKMDAGRGLVIDRKKIRRRIEKTSSG